MTDEQKAAYVMSQTACALAKIESMKAANWRKEMQDQTIAYGEGAFLDVLDEYGLHHNTVIGLFHG